MRTDRRVHPDEVRAELAHRLTETREKLGPLATPRVLRAIKRDFLEDAAGALDVSLQAIRKHLDPAP